MSNSDFNAYSWLSTDNQAHSSNKTELEDRLFHESLADFSRQSTPQNSFNRFFVPGWKGESLVSKEVKEFTYTLSKIHEDTKNKFLSIGFLNSKLKEGIYEEFLKFADFKAINFTGIDTSSDFFYEIKNKDSEYRKELDQFLDIYTFRTSVIFILKIRFISIFTNESSLKFDEKNVFYPSAFLTRIFRKGSSTELNSEALKQNIYSWYRPDSSLKGLLVNFFNLSNNLSITEIIKNISILSEEKLSHKAEYSHSISHKNFGLFLNSLLINFPLWLNRYQPRFKNNYKIYDNNLEVISSMYDGDYLESMSLSHWLAQDTNKFIKWDQILCPSFNCDSFDKGLFTKIINELQFLSFLSEIAKKQNRKTTQFICDVMQGHLRNRKESLVGQKNLFGDISTNKSTYNRLILNLTNYPKSNIQHYILNTIQKKSDSLKDNGLIFLISPKKIFIPSQKTKVEAFLKKFNLEALFDLSEVSGKGEVGDYIYIFSKNTKLKSDLNNSFLNFRLNGNLNSFSEFESITNLIHNFFINSIKDIPSIMTKGLKSFNLEFYQDAIVDGQMIHTSSSDSNKITHPLFFKNLTRSCTTLNKIFEISHLKDEFDYQTNSLIHNVEGYQGEVLIVDQREKNQTVLEIVNSKLIESKIESYGRSLTHYFKIIPKWQGISTHALVSYFNSQIGRQVVDLTFNNKLNRIKANLQKLLVPNFFTEDKDIPKHISPALSLLELSRNKILEIHPQSLMNQFESINGLLKDIVKDYPKEVINKISEFQKNIGLSLDLFNSDSKKSILNFNNPMLRTPLLLAKTNSLYPNNEDIFIDFNSSTKAKDIHLPLTHFKSLNNTVDDVKTYQIDLYSSEVKVLSFYSDIEMINFLEFLLPNAKGIFISELIQNIRVPELETLKSIIESFSQMQKTLNSISKKIDTLQNSLFSISINKS